MRRTQRRETYGQCHAALTALSRIRGGRSSLSPRAGTYEPKRIASGLFLSSPAWKVIRRFLSAQAIVWSQTEHCEDRGVPSVGPDTSKAAVYARVSTANNGQSPEMQLRDFSEYCTRRGWTVAGEYVDVGITGSKEERPELDRLMADAHRRRFDVVVVWKFDRFSRSVSHLLRALEPISTATLS